MDSQLVQCSVRVGARVNAFQTIRASAPLTAPQYRWPHNVTHSVLHIQYDRWEREKEKKERFKKKEESNKYNIERIIPT